jgi:hypothetical protein
MRQLFSRQQGTKQLKKNAHNMQSLTKICQGTHSIQKACRGRGSRHAEPFFLHQAPDQ